MSTLLKVQHLGLQEYQPIWEEMKSFTASRTHKTPDEIWLLQHPPVFTLGQNADKNHLLDPGNIPVIPIDRGGQVTYHGPGQLIAYLLIDLKRKELGIRSFVNLLEKLIIDLLARYGIEAKGNASAHGVYVKEAKIASIGLRLKRFCTFHGISLNVDMDLTPFSQINPCGMPGLQVTQLKTHAPHCEFLEVEQNFIEVFNHHFISPSKKVI
jgi:lipoyl(octanoyl) transferase